MSKYASKYRLSCVKSLSIQKNLPVTGFPLASVTATDWTDSVIGFPLPS